MRSACPRNRRACSLRSIVSHLVLHLYLSIRPFSSSSRSDPAVCRPIKQNPRLPGACLIDHGGDPMKGCADLARCYQVSVVDARFFPFVVSPVMEHFWNSSLTEEAPKKIPRWLKAKRGAIVRWNDWSSSSSNASRAGSV